MAAARGAGTGGRRLDDRARRAVPVALRRGPAGGELHRLRALPLGPSGTARRPGAAGGAPARGPPRRPRAAVRDRPSRGGQQRRLPGVRQRAGRPAGTAQPLRTAPALHDRAAARLGRDPRRGLLLRLAAVRGRPVRRLRGHRPQLQPRAARRRDPRLRGHDLRPGPGGGRVPAARAGAVRPGRRAAPAVRRGRGRLPPGHAGTRPGGRRPGRVPRPSGPRLTATRRAPSRTPGRG